MTEIPDTPDPRTDPDVDEVLGDAQDEATQDVAEPYELRSMPVQPTGTDDDPASFINP